jgi:SagB-type dehydrogenase family enzyme
MEGRFHLSFGPGVEFLQDAAGQWEVRGERVRIPVPDDAGILEAVGRLARGGATGKALVDQAERKSAQEAGIAATQMTMLLFGFSREGLLCRSVVKGKPLVTSVPLGAYEAAGADEISRRSRFVLSRFACVRRDGERMVVESPLGAARVILHGARGIRLLDKLARPCRASDLSGGGKGMGERTALDVLELLWHAGVVTPAGKDGVAEEETRDTLIHWEFHDLFFHTRSRQGRHGEGYGGTDRFKGRFGPLPAIKPAMSGEAVDLPKPDMAAVERGDAPFTRVLEGRRSSRRQGERPITLAQLSEFLYRVARVRGMKTVDGEEYSERVYPSAGGAYELEFYLAINRCGGLAPGFYHYQPLEHRLYRLAGGREEVERLLVAAARTTRSDEPQVLLVLAARFARLTRRYESLAYAMILKDVGVVFQTMYLVATAMGLAGCALGGGDSDVFARATGLDYFEESSVGEFMLGSAPKGGS